jgi:hypothetical protein
MRARFLVAALVLSSCVFPLAAWAAGGPSGPSGPHVAGELLVAAAGGVSDTELEQQYRAHGGQLIRMLPRINVHHIRVAPQALDAVEAALEKNPHVRFVERNFLAHGGATPNDPGYGSQWYLPKISSPAGWDITKGSWNVPIAVIDSGVDPVHPDLSAKLIPGYNFLGGNTDTHDVLGHGTAVAGVAAAITNDSMGVAGVAWENAIMPLVVLDASNYASYANIASAITYAADHGAKVINISIGGSSYSSTLQSAVDYAWNHGLVIAACAMNYSTSTPYYPAALAHVLAVSATDQNDQPASFTDYGNWISLAAPGTSIYTTTNGGGYGYWQGTSFSSPQVAALAALLFSLNPSLTNTQVVNLMKSSTDDLGTGGFDPYFGWGRINVAKTLQAANSIPADTTPPTAAITSPATGSSVSGTVNVQVSATDAGGVAKVQLSVDGGVVGTLQAAPYTFAWNTSGLSGSHNLVATAYDIAGNWAPSTPIGVIVMNPIDTTPPSVQITSTTWNGKNLSVSVSASDSGTGVASVQLYVDGVLKATDTSQPWTFKLNTGSWKAGSHSLAAKAVDGAGNVGVSSPVTVTTK